MEIVEAQIEDSYSVYIGEGRVCVEKDGVEPACRASHMLEKNDVIDFFRLHDNKKIGVSSRYKYTSTHQKHETPVFRVDQFEFVERSGGLQIRISDQESPFFNCVLPHTDNVLDLTREKRVVILGKDGTEKIVKKYGCPFDGCDYYTEKRERIVRHAFSAEHMMLSRESFVKAIAPYLSPELQGRTLRALQNNEQFAFWHQEDPSCLSNSYGNQRMLHIALKAGEMQSDCDEFIEEFCIAWNELHSKYGSIEWEKLTRKATFPAVFDNTAGCLIWTLMCNNGGMKHKTQHCIGRIPTNDGFNTERGMVTADNFIYTRDIDNPADSINVETKCFQDYQKGMRLEVINESLSTHAYLYAKRNKEFRLNIFFALKDHPSLINWRMGAFFAFMAQKPIISSRLATLEEAAHHGYNGGIGGRLHLLGDGGITVTKFRDTDCPDVKEAVTFVWFPSNEQNPRRQWNKGNKDTLDANTADKKLTYFYWVLRSKKNFFEIDAFATLVSEISNLRHGYKTSYRPQFLEMADKIRRLYENEYNMKYLAAEMENIDDRARHATLVEETRGDLKEPEPWREKKQIKDKSHDIDRKFISAALDMLLTVPEKKKMLGTTRMDKPLEVFIDVYYKLLLSKDIKERLKDLIKKYVFNWMKLTKDKRDIDFTSLQGGAKGCDKKSSPERSNIVILCGLYSFLGNITEWFNNRGNARSDVHRPPKLSQVPIGVSACKFYWWGEIKNILRDRDVKDLERRIDDYVEKI